MYEKHTMAATAANTTCFQSGQVLLRSCCKIAWPCHSLLAHLDPYLCQTSCAQGLEGLLQETGERSGRSSPAPLSRGALDAGRLARAATESTMLHPDAGKRFGGPDRSYSTGNDHRSASKPGYRDDGYGGYGRASSVSGGGGHGWQHSGQSSPRDSLSSGYPETPTRSVAGGEHRPLRHATSDSLAASGGGTTRRSTFGKPAPWDRVPSGGPGSFDGNIPVEARY